MTESPIPAQMQEQYGAISEKKKMEVYETHITQKEPTHKGCDVVYQNHLGKMVSIQQNDLDLSQAAALNGSGWPKVIKCNESPREKSPWTGLDPPKTAVDSALPWSARTTFCCGLESPMACQFHSIDSDTQKVNWNGLDPPRVALALDRRQLQFYQRENPYQDP